MLQNNYDNQDQIGLSNNNFRALATKFLVSKVDFIRCFHR